MWLNPRRACHHRKFRVEVPEDVIMNTDCTTTCDKQRISANRCGSSLLDGLEGVPCGEHPSSIPYLVINR